MARPEAEIMQRWKLNESPLASVICVTYNHEPYIRDAIEGFLMQDTDFPFEVVIGEDCSSDGTKKIIDEYQNQYPQIIRVLETPKNLGAYANFIRTLYSARGKYLAYCEGDDYWIVSSKLQQQVKFLEDNKEFSMAAHSVAIIDNTVQCESYRPYETFEEAVFSTEDILLKHFIPSLSWVFKASLLYFPDWYRHCWSGDIALELIISLAGPGRYFQTDMGVYRHHDGGVTKQKRDPKTGLQKDIFLFKSFDGFTNGSFSSTIRKRMSKIYLSYSLCRLLNCEFMEFALYILRAFRLYPSYFFLKLFLPLLLRKVKSCKHFLSSRF